VSPLSLADRNLLLALARRSIEVALVGSLAPPERFEGALGEPRGAFVTLKRREDDELRGCIGRIEAREPLGVTVAHVAVAAATEDPRFPPLSPHELPGVRIEVSILMPGSTVYRSARIRRAIIDRAVEVPAGAVIGYDPAEDRRRHTVSEGGVVVVTPGEECYVDPKFK